GLRSVCICRGRTDFARPLLIGRLLVLLRDKRREPQQRADKTPDQFTFAFLSPHGSMTERSGSNKYSRKHAVGTKSEPPAVAGGWSPTFWFSLICDRPPATAGGSDRSFLDSYRSFPYDHTSSQGDSS